MRQIRSDLLRTYEDAAHATLQARDAVEKDNSAENREAYQACINAEQAAYAALWRDDE